MSKPQINEYWERQNFRLNLKGYQGNCKACYKKSKNKLYQIAKENPSAFDFMIDMETKYGEFMPMSRLKKMEQRGEKPKFPITFYRQNKTANDIVNESKKWNGSILDDSEVYPEKDLFSETEDLLNEGSCEVFVDCGNY